ncbi:hypothetical protein Esti_005604 [Eimeria stiedai]
MAEVLEARRASACILWRLACTEQRLERIRSALRRCQPYAPAHLYASLRDSAHVRLYAPSWVRLLRLHGIRADELDGRLLASRVSSRDDGVSLADFLRWIRPTGSGNADVNCIARPCQVAVAQESPEALVASMGLLEVEAAADLAAAGATARASCKGHCVPCFLFGCIDALNKGYITEADLARSMATLQQPSFSVVSGVFRRLDRNNRGTVSAADWAVEFLHTEVACRCFNEPCVACFGISNVGLTTSLGQDELHRHQQGAAANSAATATNNEGATQVPRFDRKLQSSGPAKSQPPCSTSAPYTLRNHLQVLPSSEPKSRVCCATVNPTPLVQFSSRAAVTTPVSFTETLNNLGASCPSHTRHHNCSRRCRKQYSSPRIITPLPPRPNTPCRCAHHVGCPSGEAIEEADLLPSTRIVNENSGFAEPGSTRSTIPTAALEDTCACGKQDETRPQCVVSPASCSQTSLKVPCCTTLTAPDLSIHETPRPNFFLTPLACGTTGDPEEQRMPATLGARGDSVSQPTTAAEATTSLREQCRAQRRLRDQGLQELQQQIHKQLFQQIQTQLEMHLQHQLQQHLQSQRRQDQKRLQQSSRDSSLRASRENVQRRLTSPLKAHLPLDSVLLPTRTQLQQPPKMSHTRPTLPNRIKSAFGKRTTCYGSQMTRQRGLERCRSGPLLTTAQHLTLLTGADPPPVASACIQGQQLLGSWSGEAAAAKERQLHETLKDLTTRPDFCLVDVWRVLNPEGNGVSDAKGVQDGMSRLGIRCFPEEAESFIWYYCPPDLTGLTFPVFAGLFAVGGDKQLPLLQCMDNENPCTIPAAYLALSAKTRKMLATFLRLALDKASISREIEVSDYST